MRLNKARVATKEMEEWTEEDRAIMQPFVDAGDVHNIFKTLLQHPDLMRRWLVFANHILFKSTLPPRERELVILRIGYLCNAGYEWGQHVLISRKIGMDEETIASTKVGPSAPGISEVDSLLMKATDELHEDAFVTDSTWNSLLEHFQPKQLMDLVFTVGQYNLVSMALNTLGVQPDDGLPGWDLK